MAKGTVNKVIILGRLGSDPEVRYMPSGSAVANLSVATNDGYKDKNTGEYVTTTEWHRVVLFGRSAEVAGQYLKKGGNVYVEGRIRTSKWQDKNGQDRYTTEIVGNEMQLLNAGGGQGGGEQGFNQMPPQQQSQPAAAPRPQAAPAAKPQPATAPAESFEQGFDDEIPF